MEYLFDIGNSNEGKLGMCLLVLAETTEEAVEKANAYLADLSDGYDLPRMEEHPDIEYARVYFNAEGGLTRDDIWEEATANIDDKEEGVSG